MPMVIAADGLAVLTWRSRKPQTDLVARRRALSTPAPAEGLRFLDQSLDVGVKDCGYRRFAEIAGSTSATPCHRPDRDPDDVNSVRYYIQLIGRGDLGGDLRDRHHGQASPATPLLGIPDIRAIHFHKDWAGQSSDLEEYRLELGLDLRRRVISPWIPAGR